MRAICAALLFLTACATTPPPPPERLAGCWIARGENGQTRTLRWLPDADRPGVMNGDLLAYEASGTTQNARFTLEPRDSGWAFCTHADAAAPHCRAVAEGQHGSLEGGRVFIDSFGDTLHISVFGEGPEQVIFRGHRDGCD
jgi:hypothetical protein